jgi:hypothetical protein
VLAYRGNEPVIALAETKDCRLADGRNLAGDAINVVTFEGANRSAVRRRPLTSSKNPCC